MQLIIFCRVPCAASISSLRSICPSELWQQIWHSIFRVSELPEELISGKKLQCDRRGRWQSVESFSTLMTWVNSQKIMTVSKRWEYLPVLGSSGRRTFVVQIFSSQTTYSRQSSLHCSCTILGNKTWNQLVKTRECVSHWCYITVADSLLLSICECLNHKCTTWGVIELHNIKTAHSDMKLFAV